MISFWMLIGALTVAALMFTVLPLLGRGVHSAVARRELNIHIHRERLAELEEAHQAGDLDDAEFAKVSDELERALLVDLETADTRVETHRGSGRIAAVVIAIALPVAALLMYQQLGVPKIIPYLAKAQQDNAANAPRKDAQGRNMPSVSQMITKLEKHLQEAPKDLRGWRLLGHSYMALERYADAVRAYTKAYELKPEDPELLTDYAEALGMAANGNLTGRASDMLEQALKLEPRSEKALWLGGIAAYQRNDFMLAAERWQNLNGRAEPGSDIGKLLTKYLKEARAQLSPAQLAELDNKQPQGTPQAVAPAKPTVSVEVQVMLDPMLKAKAAPDDTLFIFARAAQGPPMPLAVVRRKVKDLPITVTLDDTMGMIKGMNLSAFPQVVIGARISKSGNPMPQSGDLQGLSAPLDPKKAPPVTVTIDKVVP